MARVESLLFVLLFIPTSSLLTFSVGCVPSASEGSRNEFIADIPSPNLPGAPLIPERSVLRPYCKTKFGQVPAGEAAATAFAVSMDSVEKPIVLTAFSFLKPGEFFTANPHPSKLNEIKDSITLSDAFGSMDGVILAFSFIEIPEAGFQEDTNALAGDVLAFKLGNKNPFKTFQLSESLPSVGDKVWLSAAVFGGAPSSQRQHEAVVTKVIEGGNIQYRFENKKLSFKGTLGAPILNKEGSVVAIHLGILDEAEPLVATGNPSARFLPYLTAAVAKSHSPASE